MKPYTALERQTIMERAAALTGWLCTVDHDVAHLRTLIDREIDDGLKGTAYDGERVAGGSSTSHPERRAVTGRADQACEDLERLDHAIGLLRQAEEIMWPIVNRTDPPLKRKAGDTDPERRKPGKGKAPPHLCQVCWGHGAETERDGSHGLWCARCLQYKRTHGERPLNRAVWEELHRRGHVPIPYLRRYAPHLLRGVAPHPR